MARQGKARCSNFAYRPLTLPDNGDVDSYSKFIAERVEKIRRELSGKLIEAAVDTDTTKSYFNMVEIVRLKLVTQQNTPKRLQIKFKQKIRDKRN